MKKVTVALESGSGVCFSRTEKLFVPVKFDGRVSTRTVWEGHNPYERMTEATIDVCVDCYAVRRYGTEDGYERTIEHYQNGTCTVVYSWNTDRDGWEDDPVFDEWIDRLYDRNKYFLVS